MSDRIKYKSEAYPTFISILKSRNGYEFIPIEDHNAVMTAMRSKANRRGVEITNSFVRRYLLGEITKRIQKYRFNDGLNIYVPGHD